jgi:hypothetical protein
MSLFDIFRKNKGEDQNSDTIEKPANPILTEPFDMVTSSKSELIVRALIPITKENWPHVKELGKKKIWLAKDENLDAILEQFDPKASGSYIRCDDLARPFIVNGNKTRIQLWTRRDMPVDADHMVMIQSDVFQSPTDGQFISFRPQLIVRGKNAPFVMIYRMSCCGATSYSALISVGDKSGKNFSNALDSNPKGIEKGMGSGVFFNAATNSYKIKVADENDAQILETMHNLIKVKQNIPSASPTTR